jgi:hypothetical protein
MSTTSVVVCLPICVGKNTVGSSSATGLLRHWRKRNQAYGEVSPVAAPQEARKSGNQWSEGLRGPLALHPTDKHAHLAKFFRNFFANFFRLKVRCVNRTCWFDFYSATAGRQKQS